MAMKMATKGRLEHKISIDIVSNLFKGSCSIVNHFVDAKLAEKLNINRRRADHTGPAQLGKLHRDVPHPTGSSVDGYGLPFQEICSHYQCLPRSQNAMRD